MTQGARSRKVLFPAGEWVDLSDYRIYKGGTTATVKAPLEWMPIFVRKGSFIPRYELPIENVTQYDLHALTVDYYPGAEPAEYTLFDDDRKSTSSLSDGNFLLTTFRGQQLPGGEINLSVTSDKSPSVFDWMPNSRQLTLQVKLMAKAPKSVSVSDADGSEYRPLPKADYKYDARTRTLTLTLPFTGQPLRLRIN